MGSEGRKGVFSCWDREGNIGWTEILLLVVVVQSGGGTGVSFGGKRGKGVFGGLRTWSWIDGFGGFWGVALIGFSPSLTLPILPSLLFPSSSGVGNWERKGGLSMQKREKKSEKKKSDSSGHPSRASLDTRTGLFVFVGEGK